MKSKCWISKGYKLPAGYIILYSNGKRKYAHRLSYELKFGEIPKGLYVCHKCDNPPCHRPSHLFLGTQKDNIADMVKKGRSAYGDKNGSRKHPERMPRGINHVNSKLNPSKIRRIRKMWSDGKLRMKDIGKIFKVDAVSIFNVIHKKTWSHVK